MTLKVLGDGGMWKNMRSSNIGSLNKKCILD